MYRENKDDNPIPTPESVHSLWIAPVDEKLRIRREKLERFKQRFDAAAIEAIKKGKKDLLCLVPSF